MNNEHSYKQIYDLCKQHMHAYVLAEAADGSKFDGIITGLDDEYAYFAAPIDSNEPFPLAREADPTDERQFGYPYFGAYGYPGYGFYGPRRRFRRLVLPLAALTAISLLPWY